MARLNTENLFLLEFLIDDLNLQSKCNCTSPGEVCVSFQFLDNEPMDVCEGDFNPEGSGKFGEGGGTTSKTGKSCLFSLAPAQAKKVAANFNIVVNVFKKMPAGWEPDTSCIGSATISVLPLYVDLINNPEITTTSKVLQDTHKLIDAKGGQVGTVSVYVRMSCYGKMIITQFEMNLDDNSVLFKGKDGQSMYRYKKTKKSKTTRIEDLSNSNLKANSPVCYQPPQPSQFPTSCSCSQPPDNFATQNYPTMPPANFNSSSRNMNCPTQSCFPGYGQSMAEMGLFPSVSGTQQVSFNRSRETKSACGGCCRRN